MGNQPGEGIEYHLLAIAVLFDDCYRWTRAFLNRTFLATP
jgi:hypothetical protein